MKVPCRICGAEIQTSTAARTRGLCMPCSEGRRTEPEDFDEVRRRWSRRIVASAGGGPPRFAWRYEAGEREVVWDELHRLDLRRPTSEATFEEIVGCARLTMRRVRSNIEALAEGLAGLGYRFWCPEAVHVSPSSEDLTTLAALENLCGPLPLTLRLFYEEVGAVDFRQSPEQIFHEDVHRRAPESPLQTLGAYDPLYVPPVAHLAREAAHRLIRLSRRYGEPPGGVRLACTFAPDEHLKANRSGDNYQLYLPEPAVDIPLVGANLVDADRIMDDEDQYPCEAVFGRGEFFVSYLRRSFLNGGFRGRSDPDGDGPRIPPHWAPLSRLAATLMAV